MIEQYLGPQGPAHLQLLDFGQWYAYTFDSDENAAIEKYKGEADRIGKRLKQATSLDPSGPVAGGAPAMPGPPGPLPEPARSQPDKP